MKSTERHSSGQTSSRRPTASQLTVDSSTAPASPGHKQRASRCLACRADFQLSRSPSSGSPRTPSSSGVSRPPWNSSSRVAEVTSPQALASSHSSSITNKHNMSSAEASINGADTHTREQQLSGGFKPTRTPGNHAKHPRLIDAIPGSEQVLGLVKEYITPGSSEQQEKQLLQSLKQNGSQPSPGPIPMPPIPRELLPAVGVSAELTAQHLAVLGAWYCLYCPDREAQQVAALTRHYAANANFEDNFVQVFGRDQLGVQFYGLRCLCKRVTLDIEKVELLTATDKQRRDTYQLRIVSRISFYLPALIRGPVTSLVLPPAIEIWATDTLTVQESSNLVIHHQQRVHNVITFPWPVRACVGFTSSLFMMHVLGW